MKAICRTNCFNPRSRASQDTPAAVSVTYCGKWQGNQNISGNYRTIHGMVAQISHRMPPLLLMLPLSPARKDVKIDAYQLLNERNL
ncbi:MAG: hypothetical protein WBR09_16485, partial [Serratia proteamaculans]